MSPEPLVSVLIALYNPGKAFEKCLSSVCAQSHTNIEIIIADDASADESPAYARAFAAKDSRISYFRLEHGGSAAARNAALKQAKGDYIVFVDADDYVHRDYVSHLLGLCFLFKTRCAMCRFEAVSPGQREFHNPPESEAPRVMDFNAYMEAMFTIRESEMMVLWNKIYERELWQNFFFDTDHFLDDRAVWKIIKKSGKIAVSTNTLYYYVRGESSLMRSPENIEKHIDAISYMDEIYLDAIERGCKSIEAKACLNKLFIILKLKKDFYTAGRRKHKKALGYISKEFRLALAACRRNNYCGPGLRLKIAFYYALPRIYNESLRHKALF